MCRRGPPSGECGNGGGVIFASFRSAMRCFWRITLASLCLFSCAGVQAQTDDRDVFVPIAKYIVHGDAESLSAWFADNLEISVISPMNNCSKNQARLIMKSFFENYTPRSFEISHKAGRPNMKYALGILNAGGENFNITIFVRCKGDDYLIQQIKIERIQ